MMVTALDSARWKKFRASESMTAFWPLSADLAVCVCAGNGRAMIPRFHSSWVDDHTWPADTVVSIQFVLTTIVWRWSRAVFAYFVHGVPAAGLKRTLTLNSVWSFWVPAGWGFLDRSRCWRRRWLPAECTGCLFRGASDVVTLILAGCVTLE